MAILFSFAACKKDVKISKTENNAEEVRFTETENRTIVAPDGSEYTFVGLEGQVWCFGEWEFIGHVTGEKESFVHLGEIKTGMYSVNGNQDVLARFFPDSEFACMYVKSDLLKTGVDLSHCIRFVFVKDLRLDGAEIADEKEGITECEAFLDEIRNSQRAKDAGLYELVRQPDGMLKNCHVYGYVCGVVQENLNLVIPLQIMSFDDKAYSITVDDIEYVLPQEWEEKLFTEYAR